MFSVILLGRLLAGVGTSAGLVIGITMIKETHDPTQARHVLSLIMMFYALAQSLAMVCGGWLSHYFGLSSIFVFMLAVLLILLYITSSMQETYQGKPIPIDIGSTCKAYFNLHKYGTYVLLIIIATTGSAINYIFNGIGPFYAAHQLSMLLKTYGERVMIPSVGLILGAFISTRLSSKCGVKQCIWIYALIMICAAVIMLVNFLFGKPSLLWILLPATLSFLGAAMVLPNGTMAALGTVENPIHASAALTSIALLLGSILLHLGTYLFSFSDFILPLLLLALPCISVLCLLPLNLNN